jgi:hypothetical protein
MSYVPATFTAGFALILTAAGAASSEWVSDLQRSYVQAAPARAQAQQEAAEAATEGFRARTAAYATFHEEVEKTIPALEETSDPKKIAEREKALGEALIKARPGARVGEYFGDFATPLRRIIREDFTRRQAADRQALVQEVPPGVKVDINTIYPSALPLATFPPALLRVLPDLPEVLEYRIVGRDLILLDTKGNVVVDVLRNVFPA